MTVWRWEEFSRCDKFPTTPVRQTGLPAQMKPWLLSYGGGNSRNAGHESVDVGRLSVSRLECRRQRWSRLQADELVLAAAAPRYLDGPRSQYTWRFWT